jgi:hypothetical protein
MALIILFLAAVSLAGGQELCKLFLAIEYACPDAKEPDTPASRARRRVMRATPRRFAACFSESRLG